MTPSSTALADLPAVVHYDRALVPDRRTGEVIDLYEDESVFVLFEKGGCGRYIRADLFLLH
jgi:hypothetical protein